MIAILGFVLGTAAAMAFTGATVSLATLPAWPVVARLSAARRADAAFAIALLPAASALAIGLAVAIPSMRHGLGLAADHCAEHLHHAHLCWLHADSLPPLLAVLGATALAGFMLRATPPLISAWRASRLAKAFLRVARSDADVIWVPGAKGLCHVVGVSAPRVFVWDGLAGALGPSGVAVVLDHERAHIRRRDPAIGLVVAVAAAFGLPWVADGWRTVWRHAAEESADADTATIHGRLAVADTLVRYARLGHDATPAVGVGFGQTGVEARVLHLIEGCPRSRPTLALPMLLAVLVGVVVVAVGQSDALHHQVEDFAHALSFRS